jgi:translocation and assembly module TamA
MGDGTIDGVAFDEQDNRLFSDDNSSVVVGVEWDWPVIQGSGFETVGHHEQIRLFTADRALGSRKGFSQLYLSSRWNFLATERLKLLFRGEVGYSDADVDEIELGIDGDVIDISLTELPNFYRFQAGGSQSVRGYAFESLSNNGVGSNNLITLSAEAEWQILQTWSLAAFYDVGNAFNDWNQMDLKQGAGVGVRWYSIAGAVRLDFASGLDLPGDPWRIHFTLGVPLL